MDMHGRIKKCLSFVFINIHMPLMSGKLSISNLLLHTNAKPSTSSVAAFVSPRLHHPHNALQRRIFSSNSDAEFPYADGTDLLDSAAPKKHTVIWETRECADLSFDVYEGETLRTAALRRDVASPHNGRANLINCRGLGTCGTCAVEIVRGAVDPPERNSVEQLRLSFPPHNFHDNVGKLRLACQIQVRGDITVAKHAGFWGQREDVASPSSPTRPFGELEYLLDSKSPPDKIQ